MSGSLEKKILEDMEKTGYPTEIMSASIMQGRGWEVTHKPSYWDEDERKSREFDIIAFRGKKIQNIYLAACRRELFDRRLRCIVPLAHEQKMQNRR
jgi:hypothetical protein